MRKFWQKKKKRVSTKQAVYLGIFLMGLVGFLAYFGREGIYKIASRASSKTASLVIDVSTVSKKIDNSWQHIAQGGEDLSSNMFSPVENELKGLEPKTVRIDHMYDGYGVVRREGGQLVFDWSRLDEVVKSITDAGATPMLSLSYMPVDLANGDIVGQPDDWNEWSLVVERTIEHYSKTLAIPNISYEVWNEPDLFGGYKTYGDVNYLNMYSYAVYGANRVRGAQPYEIGGPATTAFYSAWMQNLLKHTTNNSLRLDFLSWHKYSINIDDYEKDARKAGIMYRKYLDRFPRGIKLYLTESGPNSENDPSYDRQSGAAHLVSVAAALRGKVDRIYAFELVDGKDPEGQQDWGRWGMVTHPEKGVKIKPRYIAMQWLNRLNGWGIDVGGQGSWVRAIATKHKVNGYQLLVANYDPYGTHNETVPVTVSGLEAGTYDLIREYFGRGETSDVVNVGVDGEYI
ncbi:hypothetical protein ACFL1M_04975, partial [Patescibacteria group bacterium]